jgi:hypothetical protein
LCTSRIMMQPYASGIAGSPFHHSAAHMNQITLFLRYSDRNALSQLNRWLKSPRNPLA